MQAYHCRSVRSSVWHRSRNAVYRGDAEESGCEAERGSKEEGVYDGRRHSLSSRLLWLLFIEGEVFVYLVEQLLEVIRVVVGKGEFVGHRQQDILRHLRSLL